MEFYEISCVIKPVKEELPIRNSTNYLQAKLGGIEVCSWECDTTLYVDTFYCFITVFYNKFKTGMLGNELI